MEDALDMRGYGRFVEGLQNALFGTGQDGDMSLVVKVEARQLAMGISNALGPKTKEKGEKKLAADVKKVLGAGPSPGFEMEKRQSKYFETGIRWLYASPKFLVGVNEDDYQPQMSVSEMRSAYESQKSAGFPRGLAWTEIGQRGKQKIMRRNRIVVERSRLAQFLQSLGGRLGRLRAMFALTAYKLGQKRIPQFVQDQFQKVEADSTSIFRFVGNGPTFAIEFGARAPGIASNPVLQKAIHGQIELRKFKLLEKIKKVLTGYTYDWNNGRVFRRNRGEEMMHELEANEEMFDSLP